MRKMTPVCLAMDIGGTKVRLALIDRIGNLHLAATQATDAQQGAKKVLESMFIGTDNLLSQCAATGLEAVGIGISSCGVIAPETGAIVAAAPAIPGWEGTQLGQIFRDKYALPVFADNDANCALVGEAWKGGESVGKSGTVLMMTLGTGLGGAIMVNGELITGRHHLTGHFGIAKTWDRMANKLVPAEWFVSGSGLRNLYLQRADTGKANLENGEAVMKLAEAGDTLANVALDSWLDHLALQLHNFYWVIDPDLVLIGGGVIHSKAFWWPLLLKKLAALNANIPIAPATLGNDAGIYGAAKLVWDTLDK
jgi:glucokinase